MILGGCVGLVDLDWISIRCCLVCPSIDLAIISLDYLVVIMEVERRCEFMKRKGKNGETSSSDA